MSALIICAKPEDLNTAEKRRNYATCVIGCGQNGLVQAVLFADAGFPVICYDSDQTIISQLLKGRTHFQENGMENKLKGHIKNKRIQFADDIKEAISLCSIIIVAVSPRIDSKRRIDYSQLENLYKKIGQSIKLGSVVIVTRLEGVGVLEGMIKESLENASGFKIGTDIAVAYSPFHYPFTQRLVSSSDKKGLSIASTLIGLVSNGTIKKTDNVRASEVAALLEVQLNDVSAAFADELALFCERAKTDYLTVKNLVGIDRILMNNLGCIGMPSKEEPYLLLTDAENLDLGLRIAEVARNVNEQIVRHVADLIKDALGSCGKTLRRSRVTLLGFSESSNMRGRPKKLVKEMVQVLMAKGVRVNLYDPFFCEENSPDMQLRFKKSLSDAVEGSDCVVIAASHDQLKHLNLKKLKILMRRPSAIVDLEAVVDPDKVEKEGFIYRGLGRGVWTK